MPSCEETDNVWNDLQTDFKRGADNVAWNAHANVNPTTPKPMTAMFTQ